MILATTKFADWDLLVRLQHRGAEKRAEHGCKGAPVFRDRRRRTASGSSSTGTTPAGRAS